MDEAVSVTDGCKQVMLPEAVAVTFIGSALSCVTLTLAVDVHPFAVFLTTTVYVPAVDTVGVAEVGFVIVPPSLAVQLYEAVMPVAVGATVSVTVDVLHVIDPLLVTVAPGRPRSSITMTVAVPVQPPWLTVKVYWPAVDTDGFCTADVKPPGPVQLYVTPEALELPDRVTEELVQVIGPLTLAVALTLLCVTPTTFTLSK